MCGPLKEQPCILREFGLIVSLFINRQGRQTNDPLQNAPVNK